MSREIFALLLIILLMASAGLNILTADRLCGNIGACLDRAEKAAAAKDWPGAEKAADEALKLWLDAESYTHIFIRHSEIDSCTDTFYELKEALLTESGNTAPLFDKLRYHTESIAEMEKISLGNIF